jgi:cell fate regulator YaaT (PSP1 superfamily)
MPPVVGVRLRFSKTLWYDPAGSHPSLGDSVVVETDRGTELGSVVQEYQEVESSALPATLKPIVRVADDDDLRRAEESREKERECLTVFREMVQERRLDMKPVDVEYPLEGDRITFYFSSEERVDFRDLVKDLATRFRARIDMRQVGVRDEARAVGGVGHCGQMLCCARLGNDFQPVSIRMAKEQDLPLNPLKISGLCGRLMCCLRYEYEAYKDFKQRAPKRGAIVETPAGLAKVAELKTLRENVRIRLEDGTSFTVPLAEMGCAKGSGCPCSVSQEALEAASARSGVAMAPPKPVAEPATKPERPAQAEGGGRRRRTRKPDDGVQAQDRPAQSSKRVPREPQKDARKKQATESSEPKGESPAPKPGRSRRRRRRKPGGGAGESAPRS